ncbi:hypothetical protein [Streptomyces pratensis]
MAWPEVSDEAAARSPPPPGPGRAAVEDLLVRTGRAPAARDAAREG